MRYLLLFLLLALQGSVFGYSSNNQGENATQKVLFSVKSDLNARSNVDFKYQGQYEDLETGLCYNRFRYYDSSTGIYISQDPIRLLSKNPTIYAYTHDVNSWIDPFGLDYFRGSRDGDLNFTPETQSRQKKVGVEIIDLMQMEM